MVLDKTQEHQKHGKGYKNFYLKKNTCQNASKTGQPSHCHVNGKLPG